MTNADKKSLETVFSISICRQSGDKWQSKTLFLMIFGLHSSIVLEFLIAAWTSCGESTNGDSLLGVVWRVLYIRVNLEERFKKLSL